MKYIVALRVQVTVEAMSPQEAERIAFQKADELRKSSDAWVSSAEYIRKASWEVAHVVPT